MYWYKSYGKTRLGLIPPKSHNIGHGIYNPYYWHNFDVDETFILFSDEEGHFDRDTQELIFPFFDPDFVVISCESVEQVITQTLRGISFTNKITYCATPHMQFEAFPEIEQPLVRTVRICKNIGGHWVCDECVSRFMLAESSVITVGKNERDQRKIERAKMTPSLRYSILFRDNFKCCGCGRKPDREDGLTLHVDHIIPIAFGGKTTPENLHTLCSDCNLGKGTKPWSDDPQLSMF